MKKQRVLLGIITALFWFGQYTYPPYFGPYLSALGATATFIGFASGCYGLSQLICRIPIGIVSGLLNKHRVFVILGLLLSGVSAACMQLTTQPVWVMALRVLSGIGASMWVNYTVLFTSYYPQKENHLAISTINVYCYVGRLAASLAGALSAQFFSISAPFYASFAGCATGLVLCFFLKDIEQPPQTAKFTELVHACRSGHLLFSCFLAFLFYCMLFPTTNSFTSNYAETLNASASQVGLIALSYNLIATLLTFLSGRYLLQKLGEKGSLILGFFSMGAHCFLLSFARSAQAIILLQILAGIGGGIVLPLTMSMAIKRVDAARKSTFMGAYQALYAAGMMLGPMVAGLLIERFGYEASFFSLGGLGLAGGIIIMLLYPGIDAQDQLRWKSV